MTDTRAALAEWTEEVAIAEQAGEEYGDGIAFLAERGVLLVADPLARMREHQKAFPWDHYPCDEDCGLLAALSGEVTE